MSADGSTGTPSESGDRVAGRTPRARPTRTRPTRTRPARTVSLPTLLAAAVEKNPENTAVVFGDRSSTYREIDSRSSRLARLLLARGVGPGDFVALALTRSIESVMAVWAVAKTGAAFVPIDPNYPVARIEHMANDSGVRMGLTATRFEAAMPSSVSWIALDASDTEAELDRLSDGPVIADDRRAPIRSSDLAYVIYTSGSTGLPKGVAVTQAGLGPLAGTQVEAYGLDSDSRTLHFASPSFDASVLELLLAIAAGSTMIIVEPGIYGGADLAELLRRHRVTHAFITPAALASIDPEDVPELGVLAVGGEAYSAELMSKWSTGRRFHNVYGPTEASMVCTISQPLSAGEALVLGSPTRDMGYYVLNERLRQVPTGAQGELYLTGAGLARGYHRRFGLTAARFVANPYATEGSSNQSRLYRTGDMVRLREGASGPVIEYLGRNDFQVQVRGFRIELGEIDAALTALDGIDFAATLARRSPTGETVLAAYVLPTVERDLDVDDVLDAVGHSLPAHMVPSVVVVIDSIPLTPTGKLDRDALPEPAFEAVEFRAPSTPTELTVAGIFVDLLGAERVGLDDDFFALGGNSLIATRLAARIGAALGMRLPARSVFESPTVEALAKAADSVDAAVRAPLDASRARPPRIPLSSAQQRMWFLNRLDTSSAVNNVPVALLLRGPLDIDALQAAVLDVVGRHESLRTIYPDIDGIGYQHVLDEADAQVDTAVVPVARESVQADVMQFFTRGFDVTVEIPFRVRLFEITDPAGPVPEFVLAFVAHHISADGLSMAPLSRDVMTAYLARRSGSAPQWTPLPVQYVDYTLWQLDMLGSESDPKSVVNKQIRYWQQALDGLPEQLELPSDRPRPRVASGRGAVVSLEVEPALHTRVLEVARQSEATPFMVVHTALAVLLATLSGTTDIAVGAPVGGRGDTQLDDLVGMFVNTVVLRTRIASDASFSEVLDTVRAADIEAFDNVDVPFERLVEVLDPVRSQGRHPLVQVALFFQNFSQGSFELPDLDVEVFGSGAASAKFDLQVTFTELGEGGGLAVDLMYATDLFDESTVTSLGQRLVTVLDAVTARPELAVGDIDVLDSAERDRIVSVVNDTRVSVGAAGELLLDGFDRVVADSPDAVALVFGERALTYREFSDRVDATACLLQERGAGPGVLVGLAMRRSIELVVGMYAVLRSGAAYVPVDPDQPVERNDYILDTASPIVVLSTARDEFATGTVIPVVDITDPPVPGVPVAFPRAEADDLAYVLFTSGSTGRPKGVAVEHRAIVNQMAWMAAQYGLDGSDVYLQKTATTFDVSLWGFFLPLRTGGRLIVAAPGAQRDVEALAADIARHGVTVTDFVPSMLTVFAETVTAQSISSLRHIFVIGEALPARTVIACRAVSDARVHNLYGPTEAAVSVTYRDVSEDVTVDGSVSIGVPEWNTSVYVLDSRLHPVPAGVPGELYLAGVQLARGYVARADLSSERFVADPLGAAGSRMYRTGDLVRWSMDAERLEYIGRTDFQVKFRGQRIELGEIETALTALSSVSQAVVVVAQLSAGESLAAYVVPAVGADIEVEAVRSELGSAVPSYMVPSAFVVLDALPLNAAGKLNRRALPEPEFETRDFRAPQTPVEESVAAVFAEVLGVERVGLDDDFFALGGNSLIATRVVSRLGAVLGVTVPLRLLFEAPTVHALATRAISETTGSTVALTARERPNSIPLSMAQQRMWFLNRLEPESSAYNLPIVIRLSGELDVDALALAAKDIVGRHEVLRTVYPDAESGAAQVVRSVTDAFHWPGVESVPESEVIDRVVQTVGEGFDVTVSAPVRLRLFQVQPDEFVFVLVVHHISADGSSMAPLARDLMTAYSARARGEIPGWAPLPVQYVDYTLWQREVLGSEDDPASLMSRQLAYWRSVLADAPDQLRLPTDRPRPAVQSYAGARVGFSIDADTHRALEAVGRRHNASLFMVLHAAYVVLLARTAGVDDVVVATPVAGRADELLQDMIGQFANTLVLRTTVDSGAPFEVLVNSVRENDLDAFGHADVPFERVVEAISPVRSTAHQPLAQVGFSFQNFEQGSLSLGGLTVSPVEFDLDTTQYDVHLILGDSYDEHGAGSGMVGVFTYSTALFDESTISAIAERFHLLLSAVAADSSVVVGDVDMSTADDRASIATAGAGEERTVGSDVTLVSLFEEQVALDPGGVAVVSEDSALTYGEFDARVNQLARRLIEFGVGPEVLVGLSIRRSVDLLVGMYAVAKAGGGYVPMDPDQPASRMQYVLDTADPVVVLTTSRDATLGSSGGDRPVVEIDTIDLSGYSAESVRASERVGSLVPDSVAYVIFTSGSTGRPKGVAVSHRAIVNQLLWKREQFGLGADDVSVLKTTSTFDLSVWEFWSSLTSGGSVVMSSGDGHRDPVYLNELMAENSVTTLHVVPSMLLALASTGGGLPSSVRRVLAIGEALPPETAALVAESGSVEVFNLYGPTEAAVSVTFHRVVDEDRSTVPIGVPEWNTSVHVLDSRLRPVPVGVPGELYLAGVQLARGYVARPDLSSERFVADPFGTSGDRMYRTGDVVVRRADGELVFVGRSDAQVKIRGFRIELGEIETALREIDVVAQAVVIAKNDAHVGESLVAYVVPAVGVSVDVQGLRSALGAVVPAYMVPSAFVVLDALPLNSNGKLDRRALPDPVFEVREFRAPSNPVEESVAGVFADVLGVDRVGLDDDFFALGGNSLAATRVVSRLGTALGRTVPLRVLFEASSVEGVAARIASGEGSVRVPLTVRERPERIPLSLAQQRMWFLNQLDVSSPVNNVPIALRVSGLLVVEALRAAVADVVGRHEVLRTIYPQFDGVGYQKVLASGESASMFTVASVNSSQVEEAVVEFCSAGFDVTVEVPFRVRLFEVSDSPGDEPVSVLAAVAHHIAADGVSMTPLSRDVMTAYVARVAGQEPRWDPLAVQYADYTLWQLEVLGSADDSRSVMRRHLDYWVSTLSGMPAQLDLPSDRPRPVQASSRGGSVTVEVPSAVVGALGDVARRHSSTTFMVAHAALVVLLGRLSGTRDIAVGTPISGRGDQGLDDLVGMFVNTLVLRSDFVPKQSFSGHLDAVRAVDLSAFEHAEVPFESIVDAVEPPRSAGRHPLFQVLLAFQNHARATIELPGLRVDTFDAETGVAKFDLQFTVADMAADDGRWLVAVDYAIDLFDESTARSIADRFVRVLESVSIDDSVAVGDIEIMSSAERSKVLDRVRPAALGMGSTDLVTLFEQQVAYDPAAVAVTFEGDSMSYGQLAARANRLARELIALGAGPETLVAVALPRSAELVVALLAVMTSGAGYLPIDTTYPTERLEFVLADAQPVAVLTSTNVRGRVPDSTVPQLLIDESSDAEHDSSPVVDAERRQSLRPENTAYVIYTSGSTGLPKGVRVSHRNVAELLHNTQALYRFDRDDVWTMFHSFAFDFSVWELWAPLLSGGRVVVVDYVTSRSPAAMRELLAREGVTVLNQTPSAFYQLIEADRLDGGAAGDLSLRYVIFGGEALDPGRLEGWFDMHGRQVELVNMYGITETTVHVTHRPLSEDSVREASMLGDPIPGLGVFVLDSRLRPVPSGVAGEMYVCGGQLARGYLDRPDLDAARFVASPFGPSGGRMYRTGDIARLTDAGDLEYIGRSDSQVQLRGFRIELGEIEAAFERHQAVARAVAHVHSDDRLGERLIAYVLPRVGFAPESTELLEFVGNFLTGYMVPDALMMLSELPLTANGKLDRRALPEPAVTVGSSRAPSTESEEIVARVFGDRLGVTGVGADDDFFSLGGNSLLAMKLVSSLSQAFGDVKVPVSWLFSDASVSSLAARIDAARHSGTQSMEAGGLGTVVTLRGGSGEPLFCVHPIVGLSWAFGGLAPYLDSGRPIYGLQSPALAGDPLPDSIDEWAEAFVHRIREIQTTGPYHLLGWSMGGVIAHAMAVKLRALGETVSTLAMMDSFVLSRTTHLGERRVTTGEVLGGLGIDVGHDADAADLTVDSALELLATMPAPFDELSPDRVENIVDGITRSAQMLHAYEPAHFDGEVLYFASVVDDPTGELGASSWNGFVDGEPLVRGVHSTHWQMASGQALAEIGPVLEAWMSR